MAEECNWRELQEKLNVAFCLYEQVSNKCKHELKNKPQSEVFKDIKSALQFISKNLVAIHHIIISKDTSEMETLANDPNLFIYNEMLIDGFRNWLHKLGKKAGIKLIENPSITMKLSDNW